MSGIKKEITLSRNETKSPQKKQGFKRPLANNCCQVDDYYYDQFCEPSLHFSPIEKYVFYLEHLNAVILLK